MSVCTTAIHSHNWLSISGDLPNEIARFISPGNPIATWRRLSVFNSPQEEFEADGSVSFSLASGFTVRFGKRTVCFSENASRWATFLIDREIHQQFLRFGCRVASLAGATELLLLPEGTLLMDKFYDGSEFETIKRAARDSWGPPDLDVHQIYPEDQILQMSDKRVHYILVETSELLALV